MKAKSTSTLGFIMNYTNTPTANMAQALHIDASLVSKWKTGARKLSFKSIYFTEVVDFILGQYEINPDYRLREAINHFYPLADLSQKKSIRENLVRILIQTDLSNCEDGENRFFDDFEKVNIGLCNDLYGLRLSLSKLLDMAESMEVAGELTFTDYDSFFWLTDDPVFAKDFCSRLTNLLNNGFKATFILHYSNSIDESMSFFRLCHELIFNRNIKWLYYENYDNPVINISFCILNSAVSIMYTNLRRSISQAYIYTNPDIVLNHKKIIKEICTRCHHLFKNYELEKFSNVVNDIYHFIRHGTVYAILSAPAFISVEPSLMKKVLIENNVSSKKIAICMDINSKFREKTNHGGTSSHNSLVYIFRLESMIKRTMIPFVSTSLSLICGQDIHVSPVHYAEALINISELLLKNENLNVVLATENDNLKLPKVNCWCNSNSWIFQMDSIGFRLSEEPGIIGAISNHLENSIARIPPTRKDRILVSQYLKEFANDIHC